MSRFFCLPPSWSRLYCRNEKKTTCPFLGLETDPFPHFLLLLLLSLALTLSAGRILEGEGPGDEIVLLKKGKSRLDSGIVIVVASVLGRWGRRRRGHDIHSGQQRPNTSPPFPPSLHLRQWGEKEARKCSDVPVFPSPPSPPDIQCVQYERTVRYWLLVKSCCRFNIPTTVFL